MWLTIAYQKPFVVSIPVLSFQIFTAKLILWTNISLTYDLCKLDFFLNKQKHIFSFSSLIVNYWCSMIILWKFKKEKEKRKKIRFNKQNLLKICIQTTRYIDFFFFFFFFFFAYFATILLWEKRKYLIFLKPLTRIELCHQR